MMRRVLVLAAVIGCCHGAELTLRDLQAQLILPPSRYSFQLDTPAGSRSGEDGYSTGTALALGGIYSLSRAGDAFGLVGEADLVAAGYRGQDSHASTFGGRVAIGVGYAITDNWIAVTDFGYSYGISRFDAGASNGAPAVLASGTYAGEDLQVSVRYHLTREFAVEGLVGYQWDAHRLSGSGVDLHLDQNGAYAGIGVSWRFSSAPERIE
jgi:hypothetical protein